MLYWAGNNANKFGVIEAVSLDGLNRTVIFYSEGYHPFSLDVHGGFLYWSDWAKNAILRVSKIDGSGEEVIVDDLDRPMGLKILHPRAKLGRKVTRNCKDAHLGLGAVYTKCFFFFTSQLKKLFS